MSRFDVLIAGAGPAGTVAARVLAAAGARVALLDGTHPREKPCGGGVTGRALSLAGAAVPREAGRPIATAIFEAGGRAAQVRLPDEDMLKVYPREAFDAALAEAAADAGAERIEARVSSAVRVDGSWTVTVGGERCRAPWLLVADGAASALRKQVFRTFGREQLSIAAGSYVDGVDTNEIVIGFVDRPRGYLWSFPRPGHLAVGTCAQADESTAAEMHAYTDAWLDRYPAAAGRPRRRYAWPIPSLTVRGIDTEQPAGDGWLLLGDAAGLVDPITREGIFFALRSGELAAAALATADPRRAYDGSVRDELHDELRRAARFKAGFFRPRFTHLLIDALEHSPAIRGVMIDLIGGRQPYLGLKRRLLSTFEWGLMLKALAGR